MLSRIMLRSKAAIGPGRSQGDASLAVSSALDSWCLLDSWLELWAGEGPRRTLPKAGETRQLAGEPGGLSADVCQR